MQNWHFRISGRVFIPDDGTNVEIHPENFVNLIRISDYQQRNMPIILTRLSIDKALFDKIIKHAQTAVIRLTIEKFSKMTEVNPPGGTIYLQDDFSVMISNDINYNKELDYNSTDLSGTKGNVYKETYIGLIGRQCIDANKIVANSTVYNSNMQDIVMSYMQNTHLLIEPFDNNEMERQLIIPPKETLAATIEYLNSIKVFYDTQYLFFIDEPFATYLVSRSGKGVKSKRELYNNVNIKMKSITDSNSMKEGMEEDPETSSYVTDISVMDSMYTIDHDTAKVVDQIDAVINPNDDNTADKQSDNQIAKTHIQKVIENFKKSIEQYSKDIKNMAEKINKSNKGIFAQCQDFLKPLTDLQNKFISGINSNLGEIPISESVKIGKTTVSVDIISSALKSATSSGMKSIFGKATQSLDKVNQFQNTLNDTILAGTPSFYRAEYLDNLLDSVSYINAQDVIDATIKQLGFLNKGLGPLTSGISKVNSQLGHLDSLNSHISGVVDKVASANEKLQKVINGPYGKYLSSGTTEGIAKVTTNLERMQGIAKEISSATNSIKGFMSNITGFVGSLSKFTSSISNFAQPLSQIKTIDIKSNFVQDKNKYTFNPEDFNLLDNTSIGLFGHTDYNNGIKTPLKDISFSDISKNFNKGKLQYQDLIRMQKELAKFDLSKIGQLGISNFKSILNTGGVLGYNKAGVKILRVRNDNPNEIKNIKSEVETMTNQLTINKFGLDPSVFTPNKRYIVNNYDGHSDKDGIFIINKKTEVFTREDDSFVCNTQLNLAKIQETDSTEEDQEYEVMDWRTESTNTTLDDTGTTVSSDGSSGVLTTRSTEQKKNKFSAFDILSKTILH